jgi:hypothetical protein
MNLIRAVIIRANRRKKWSIMNKHRQYVFLPICIAASVMLGGCLGSESGDEEELMTEAEPTAEAAAAITWSAWNYAGNPGAKFRFAHYGNYVEICDTTYYDGKYAIVYYNGIFVHTGGHSTWCKVVSNKNGGSYDIPENIPVRFNVCVSSSESCKYYWYQNGNY